MKFRKFDRIVNGKLLRDQETGANCPWQGSRCISGTLPEPRLRRRPTSQLNILSDMLAFVDEHSQRQAGYRTCWRQEQGGMLRRLLLKPRHL